MLTTVWPALPLLAAISLVYAATRHESMGDILRAALRMVTWFGGFIGGALLIVYLLEAWSAS